ncbi:MAG: DEAD/DEAH box helicase [Acidobacteria bacterium]|nr:DEAD/DEAH box helicase [Acidobacteriota bacterium]
MEKPLIIQSDRTVLAEVQNPAYPEVRGFLGSFSEMVKSPEYIHTYRITPISLWNAAACGVRYGEIVDFLRKWSKYPISHTLLTEIDEEYHAFGKVVLKRGEDGFYLDIEDADAYRRVLNFEPMANHIIRAVNGRIYVSPASRGDVKQVLMELGLPARDVAGYEDGDPLDVKIDPEKLQLRPYQEAAVDIFYANGSAEGGSGVVVMPCGAGKTIVGIGIMARVRANTLVLTTNTTALKQWKRELVERTGLAEEQVGEYSGETKNVQPVTVATYQILTYRKSRDDEFKYFEIFDSRNWGLIIYDEVHLLPAPVFRAVSSLQAKRRLGLTATLVREDGNEKDVFALIGPKKFDIPWKDLERQGFIAQAHCVEIRVPLSESVSYDYSMANNRRAFRIASENPMKLPVVAHLLKKHRDDNVLIIGQYLKQLKEISKQFGMPIITGATPQKERDRIFEAFKNGEARQLAVSKVANFAVDLPDANVAIQISGTFGSRQEEAQRLGRVLRPKPGLNEAIFYTLVTDRSVEVRFARNRQIFLSEQGYRYTIENGEHYGLH